MLLSYLRLVLFAAGLLVGVQVPGFINDYAKRVEAHLIEAQAGLSGFQNTANQFFKGDMQALVAHYRASEDPIFRSDADSLGNLLTRQVALDKQFQAMQGPWYIRFLQVVVSWRVGVEWVEEIVTLCQQVLKDYARRVGENYIVLAG